MDFVETYPKLSREVHRIRGKKELIRLVSLANAPEIPEIISDFSSESFCLAIVVFPTCRGPVINRI